MSDERLEVTYRLTPAAGEEPEAKARELALEQTVELPAECVGDELAESVVGRVESLEPAAEGGFRARISFDPALVAGELSAALNLLFGNVSMQSGVRVEKVAWPEAFLGRLGGPRFGLHGLREICGAEDRPLSCAAVKPLGLSAEALAERCRQLALGGVDLIKDDHSLIDQASAPLGERIRRCQEAVQEANRQTGGRSAYFPNLAGDAALPERVREVLAAGCYGALVSPLVMGLGLVVSMAQDSGLALLGHPALAGAFFAPDHGISPRVLLGELFRMSGCDGVIFPNVGGRFALSRDDCEAVHRRLRARLGHLLPSFPVAGGGVEVDRIPEWIDTYGKDTIFLLGAGLYRQDDLRRAAEGLVSALRRGAD